VGALWPAFLSSFGMLVALVALMMHGAAEAVRVQLGGRSGEAAAVAAAPAGVAYGMGGGRAAA
jgi:hypothetical protein